ncbi:MAG: LytR/AlgR family response regulator transcription factor [Longimicrobiales bacterium]
MSALAQLSAAAVRGASVEPLRTLTHAGFIWLLFGVLSFLPIATARRFPLERRRLAVAVAAHLAAFVTLSWAHTTLYVPFARSLFGSGGRGPLLSELAGSLIANLRGDIFLYGMIVGAYYLYALSVQRRAAEGASPGAGSPEADVAPPAASSPAYVASSPQYLMRIPFKHESRVTFIETADVHRIEADGDYVRVFAKGGPRLLSQTLTSLETQLDPTQFVRVHRSSIVAIRSIRELQPLFHGEFVALLTDGAKVKVSRTYRAALAARLGLTV